MKRWTKGLLPYAALTLFGILFLVPFLSMIFNAFKANKEILGYPPTFFPKEITLQNFTTVLSNDNMRVLSSLKNSVIITVVRTGMILYLSALWGYTLSKVDFPGRRLLFYVVLSAMMVPVAVIVLPLYQEMLWFGLYDKLLSQILIVDSTTSYGVFIMRQFIIGLPDELFEAAEIDGCNEFQTFHKIILPLLKNAISAVSIVVFLYIWNDYLWPSLMLQSPENRTITVSIQFLSGRYTTDYGGLMAATCLSLLPVLLIYFLFQNRFTQGISLSGVKE